MTANAIYQVFSRGVSLQSPNVVVYHDPVDRGSSTGNPWPDEATAPSETLIPLTLTVGSNGRESVLKLSHAIRDSDSARADGRTLDYGDRIRVVTRYGNNQEVEMFRGYIGQIGIDYTPNSNGQDHEGEGVSVYGVEVIPGAILKTNWLTADKEDVIIAAGPTGLPFVHFHDDDDDDDDGDFWTFGPVVFNPRETSNTQTGNATSEDDEGYTYFMHQGRTLRSADSSATVVLQSEPWTAYTAGKWLIERIAADLEATGLTMADSFVALKATLDAIPISNVDVTGLTSIQALAKVLNPVGYGFTLTPGTTATGTAAGAGAREHFLSVYHLGGTNVVPGPWMADRKNPVSMHTEDGQKIQVVSIRYNRAANSTRNDFTVIGEFKKIEQTFIYAGRTGSSLTETELQPFWDITENSLDDYDTAGVLTDQSLDGASRTTWDARYTQGGTAYRRHTFRSFAWNEDGGLAPTLTVIPDLVNYSDADLNSIRRPRPFLKSMIYDDVEGRTLEATRVECAIFTDDGTDETSWITIGATVWKDRGGFTLTADDLLKFRPWKDAKDKAFEFTYGDYPLAQLLYNTRYSAVVTAKKIQFRLRCSVETDERIVGTSAQQDESAWPLTRRGVAYLPNRFKWQTIDNGDGGEFVGLSGAARDDTVAIGAYSNARRDVSEDALGMGSVILRGIDLVYSIGQAFASTRGYELDLTINAGGADRRAPSIAGIVYDFREGDIKTELLLDANLLQRVR